MSGDPRAAWITDENTDTTARDPPGYGQEPDVTGHTVTGDPRAAFLGGHAGEVLETKPEHHKPKPRETFETLSGDPRVAYARAGENTAVPAPRASVTDTGIHSVGTGDPRAGWLAQQSVSPADQAADQEERDLKRAIANSLRDQGLPAPGDATATGDPRASWLTSDTAAGKPHKKRDHMEGGPPADPRSSWL